MKLQMHGEWCLLTDDVGNPITNKTWHETDALAREMSERFNKRLTLIPVKTAEILCKTDEAFKAMMIKYWIWNAEIMKACKNGEELKRKLGLKTTHVDQWNDDTDISSVWSSWNSDEGCFDAVAYRPSRRNDYGVVAFLVDENKPQAENFLEDIADMDKDDLKAIQKRVNELLEAKSK